MNSAMDTAGRDRIERRLTAILAADVAGYSRLTGLDEEGTHARLKDHLRSVLEPKIGEHRGRVVKYIGDGLLAEFGSVVDAMRCALDVQRGMVARNADVPQEKRIEFRIGINVGDIIIDRGDIFGDGVNVAARLEALAAPGGICVSGRVLEDIEGKLDINFDDIGEQRLKNIARPVRAYRVLSAETDSAPSRQPDMAALRPLSTDRPSIAVLPFKNASGDPEQEYFADGITEDIITALSKWRWFLVISRNSTFAYKEESVDVRQIRRDLDVRYVLQGSVRRAGKRVRITSQLIDAARLRLSPRDPRASTWLANKARVLYHLRRYAEAVEAALAARRIRPHAYGSLVLVASYAQLGRNEEAVNVLAEIRTLAGGSAKITRGYLDRYSNLATREHMAEGLRKAGILEQ
jgi:adenylate cyclase